MKSVKELNKIADIASKSVLKTVNAFIDPQSFIESDKFVRSATTFGEASGEGVVCKSDNKAGFQMGNDPSHAVGGFKI